MAAIWQRAVALGRLGALLVHAHPCVHVSPCYQLIAAASEPGQAELALTQVVAAIKAGATKVSPGGAAAILLEALLDEHTACMQPVCSFSPTACNSEGGSNSMSHSHTW